MEDDQIIIRHRALLEDRMDSDFGLLDKLYSKESLSRQELCIIKYSHTPERNRKLLDCILTKNRSQDLITALQATGQIHLVNYLNSDGVYKPDFCDDWPLGEIETKTLTTNRESLIDLLDIGDLCAKLFNKYVINRRQQKFISAKVTDSQKNEALLDILRRMSKRQYKITIDSLNETEQSNIATILSDAGVVVRIRAYSEVTAAAGLTVTEAIEEIVRGMSDLLGGKSPIGVNHLSELQQYGLIAVRRQGEGIVLYFYSKTLEELINLHDVIIKEYLKVKVEKMFNQFLPVINVVVLDWSSDEYEKQKTYLSNSKERTLPTASDFNHVAEASSAKQFDTSSLERRRIQRNLLKTIKIPDISLRDKTELFDSKEFTDTNDMVDGRVDEKIIFRCFLKNLSDSIDSDELKRLKFLIPKNIVSLRQLEHVTSSLDLFSLLNDKCVISGVNLRPLKKLMMVIGRVDLADKIQSYSARTSPKTQIVGTTDGGGMSETEFISPLDILMYQMADELDSTAVRELKFMKDLKGLRWDDVKDGFDYMDVLKTTAAIDSIARLLEEICKSKELENAYQRVQSKFRNICSPETGCRDADCAYKNRWSTLFKLDNTPTFSTEYVSLNDEDIRICYGTIIGRGRFGTIHPGEYTKAEVAVKCIENTEAAKLKNWKMVIYLRHPFLLSVIKAVEMPYLQFIYCIRAKMNLTEFIENGSKDSCRAENRIRILCQIGDALSFLHRGVLHIRGPVVHMYVRPNNIFLDGHYNALLGELDSAVEMEEEILMSLGDGETFVDDYIDRYKDRDDKQRHTSDDIFSLGIITLQLLMWQSPLTSLGGELFDCVKKIDDRNIEEMTKDDTAKLCLQNEFFERAFQQTLWKKNNEMEKISKQVGRLAVGCLISRNNRIDANEYTAQLKAVMKNMFKKLWLSETADTRCLQCHFNEIDKVLKVISDTCTKDNCIYFSRFCKECHYFSFRNPLHCPDHGVVYPIIGNPKSYAILVCGYDVDRHQYMAFKKDIAYVKRTITDPRIMNIRLENVIEMSKDGKINDMATLESEFARIRCQGGVEFMLVYYSGHEILDDRFRLSEKAENSIEIVRLKKLLGDVEPERLLFVIDCCYAPRTELNPITEIRMAHNRKWTAVLYSTSHEQRARCDTLKGSLFTRYFLTGLQSSKQCSCEKKWRCPTLKEFRRRAKETGVITVSNLLEYICDREHIPDQNPFKELYIRALGADKSGMVIAYYNKNAVVYRFKYICETTGEEKQIELEQVDLSSPSLEEAIMKELFQEIKKYTDDGSLLSPTDLVLYNRQGKEIANMLMFRNIFQKFDNARLTVRIKKR